MKNVSLLNIRTFLIKMSTTLREVDFPIHRKQADRHTHKYLSFIILMGVCFITPYFPHVFKEIVEYIVFIFQKFYYFLHQNTLL